MTFAEREGRFREIGPDTYERVDEAGDLLGFAIFNFSKRGGAPVELPLDLAKVVLR